MSFDVFQAFDSFFSLFWIFFIIIALIIVASFVLSFWRMLKSGRTQDRKPSEVQPTIREKEIIREIVKVRCSYCGNLYDESQDKCPYCGAKH